MATDRPRYTVSVKQDVFDQIEKFRYLNHFSTRSSATEVLIQLGLDSLQDSDLLLLGKEQKEAAD